MRERLSRRWIERIIARKLFVAGSTGAIGRTLARLATDPPVDVVLHVRPKTAARGTVDPRAAVFDLEDARALSAALATCTTLVQLVGSRRARFASGDTYETSDVGTTALLLQAARGTPIDHVVLLSSLGAGRPIGAYLKAKARAEGLARASGIPYTVIRPSAFVGEGHRLPPGFESVARLPGLRRMRPIRVEQVAALILRVARERAPLGAVLEGDSLWALVP